MRTVDRMLADRAQSRPEALYVAFAGPDREPISMTYAATWLSACRWATLFVDRGLERGDRVVLALPNHQDFVGAFYGAVLGGCVPVASPPMRTFDSDDAMVQALLARVQSLAARMLVIPDRQREAANELVEARARGLEVVSRRDLPEAGADINSTTTTDDLALLQITSGTSGPARAVQLQHGAVIAQLEGITKALKLDSASDSAVSWLPLFHDMGLIGFLLTPAFVGRHVTLLRTEDFAARPGTWVQALSTSAATITGGPPSAYQLCARRTREDEAGRLDLSRVRIALVGAETVTAAALDAFALRFAASGFRRTSLMPTYGLAENGLAVTMPPPARGPRFDTVDLDALERRSCAVPAAGAGERSRSFASVGARIPGVEVAVVDRAHTHLGDRRVGEVVVKGETVMAGYFRRPGSTGEALRDGWLHTGDLGYMAGGELHITGRLKEVVIVGGRNFSPEDLERVAATAPGVRGGRVVAVSVADPATATEQVVIMAETGLSDDAARHDLKQDIRRRLVASGYPVDRVLLLPPRGIMTTASGKVMRVPCRERYLTRPSQQPPE